MKFFFCTCNISVRDRITGILDSNCIKSYQVTEPVLAMSKNGSPRLNTPVWPGVNIVLTIQASDNDEAVRIISILKNFNSDEAENENEIITVCSWPTENFFYE